MYDRCNVPPLTMQGLLTGIDIIINYEGYNEKAFPDPITGEAPYTIGFGTQYYPDGEPVERGQLCTYKKAKEYLLHEVEKINKLLTKEIPDLNECMKEALISLFIPSDGNLFFTVTYLTQQKKASGILQQKKCIDGYLIKIIK